MKRYQIQIMLFVHAESEQDARDIAEDLAQGAASEFYEEYRVLEVSFVEDIPDWSEQEAER